MLGLAQTDILSSVSSKSSTSPGTEKIFECFKAEQHVILYIYSVPSHTTSWHKMGAMQLDKHFT